MTRHAVLALIADLYTPLLALVTLAQVLAPWRHRPWRLMGYRLTILLMLLAVAYGGMLLDNHLHLWPAWGLDYSTHTAVALVLVLFLTWQRPRLGLLLWPSMACYGLLMALLHYHTLADMVTTAVAVTAPCLLILWRVARVDDGIHRTDSSP